MTGPNDFFATFHHSHIRPGFDQEKIFNLLLQHPDFVDVFFILGVVVVNNDLHLGMIEVAQLFQID